jgi:hypothetical protein
MNLTRGLFRLWLVVSALWVAGCLWHFDFSCFFGDYPWCAWWIVSTTPIDPPQSGVQAYLIPLTSMLSTTYADVLAKTFGIPLAVFLLGFVLFWVFKGFRRDR